MVPRFLQGTGCYKSAIEGGAFSAGMSGWKLLFFPFQLKNKPLKGGAECAGITGADSTGMGGADWTGIVREYEKEVRIIKNVDQNTIFRGPIKFNKKCVKEVIFGYRMFESQKKELMDVFKQLMQSDANP